MKKYIIKVTAMAMALLLFTLTFTGCGGTADVWSDYITLVEAPGQSSQDDTSSEDVSESSAPSRTTSGSSPASSTPAASVIKDGKINITQNKKSSFKIVASLSNDGYDQARLIQKVIKATSGASIPLISDYEDQTGPEIIVGMTARDETLSALETLGQNQYLIKVDKNANIIIVADSVTALNIATEKFLKDYFGYDPKATQPGVENPVPADLNVKTGVLDDYKLVWNDEFDGITLDRKKWNLTAHMSPQSDLQLRSDNTVLNVNNGIAFLTAGRIDDNNYFTNNSMATDQTMIFKYGYIEMRARLPFGRPAWPSFWMKASQIGRDNPDIMSEIDIFEVFGDDVTVTSNTHKWWSNGGHSQRVGATLNRFKFASKAEAEQWHTYSCWWTPTTLNFMVDGKIYDTLGITDNDDYGEAGIGMKLHHDYHYLIINNYIYTKGYANTPKDKEALSTDQMPIKYDIDYVRVYQKPGEGDIMILS